MRQRLGPADPESLCVVDAEALEQLERLLVLDALSDGLAPEALGEVDDCLDDVLALGVLRQVSNEVDIDLDELDLQAFEVGETTVARSEIVEREAHTEPGQLAHERLGERPGRRRSRFR